MTDAPLIREERAGDQSAIFAVTEAAFRDMPFSDGDEADLVDRLRADGDLTLSLVAERDGEIIGHIAFSPVTISDGSRDWFGLGPVSVKPELKRSGIGSALIRRGIAMMEERHQANGIILLGSNEYYARFGFEHDPELTYPGPPPEYFQRLVLHGPAPRGVVRYSPGFESSA